MEEFHGDLGSVFYTYDAENMMVRVERFTPPASLLPAMTAQYSYDPLGHRVLKSVSGVTGSPDHGVTFFLYDNEDIIAEYDAGRTSPKRTYLHGPGIDEPLAQRSGSGAIEYFHSDALGSVTNLSNAAGSPTASARYSSFGLVSASGSFDSRYSYTAREGPEETGFYGYRARQYHPGIGRFVQEDPMSVTGLSVDFRLLMIRHAKLSSHVGQLTEPLNPSHPAIANARAPLPTSSALTNLHVYVLDNPILFVDPYGWISCTTCTVLCAAAVGAALVGGGALLGAAAVTLGYGAGGLLGGAGGFGIGLGCTLACQAGGACPC